MVKKTIILIIILFLITLSSCFRIKNKKEFYKEVIVDDTFKTEGFYYRFQIDEHNLYVFPIVFTVDGYFKQNIFINANQEKVNGINYESHCKLNSNNKDLKELGLKKASCFLLNYDLFNTRRIGSINKNVEAYEWGRYSINNKKIHIRYFELSTRSDLYLIELSGLIEENRLILKHKYNFSTEKHENIELIYYFEPLDSLNINIPSTIKKMRF